MKKILSLFIVVIGVSEINAQQLMNKNGTPVLPEAKDWSIGIDAVPFVNLFGNMFNNGTNTRRDYFTFTSDHPMTIVGKYMKTENLAYRLKLRIGYNVDKNNAFSVQSGSTAVPPFTVTDSKTRSDVSIGLGSGLQWYRGKGRLKGYYGAEAFLSIGGLKDKYTYGNSITESFNSPNSTDFGPLLSDTSVSNVFIANGIFYRVTEDKLGTNFGFGVRGFVGVEYFIAAKLSIGGEFGWGPSVNSIGEGTTTLEYFDISTTPGNLKSFSINTGKSFSFSLDTDNASGSLMLSFYF